MLQTFKDAAVGASNVDGFFQSLDDCDLCNLSDYVRMFDERLQEECYERRIAGWEHSGDDETVEIIYG